ncbi:diacylglycerol/lipid kinase family protein [Rhizobium sp. G21]|uniref:diacylglycerol/lipid kinase family protein n=1 Tax=Rhizobium sp. G21 TaxID=2758439 RepID=UPI001602A562|nr:diacylglycerol kinase family protein [Rhizobium sp. G21]MBB1248242.1 diacylglycerol kinase family lipid kinase [Rhizobium sp. G21]
MKIKAILNRDGGTFRTTDMKAYEAKMAEIFAERSHVLETVVVEGSDIGAALEKAAGRDDVDAIIAGGGDGTISSAAGIAWKAGKPLGVIPAGTMNLFARTLRLPLDIWQVLPVLADGVVDDADIGSVNGRAFVHQFSAGMHARMVRYRNQMSYGSRAGKIAANVRAAVGAVLNPPRFEIEFDADGHRENRMVSAISVSNNPFGENGLLVAEDVKTGHLGFYIADPLDPAGAVGLAVDVLRGRLKANPAITEMKAQSVDLHFPKLYRAANFVLDGELMKLPRDVEIRLHPGELKVIAPADASLKPIDPTV